MDKLTLSPAQTPKTKSGARKPPGPALAGTAERKATKIADRLDEVIEKLAPYPVHD